MDPLYTSRFQPNIPTNMPPEVYDYIMNKYANASGEKSSLVLPAKSKTTLLDQPLRIGETGMVTPDTSSNEANYQRIMNVAKGNVPLDTQQQSPEYFDYYGGQPISSMGDRAVIKEQKAPVKKSIPISDKAAFAKTLGITEAELDQLDQTSAYPGFTSRIDQLMDKQKPSPVILAQGADKKGTIPTTSGEQAKTTEAPMTAKTATTPPVAGEEAKPVSPYDEDMSNRMAATAVGNIFASLGAGMAGFSPASVNQMFQGLYQQLGQRQKEREMRDPNSEMSKNYRDMIAPYLPKGLDLSNKSMFDIQQTLPMLTDKLNRDFQERMQKERLSSEASNRALTREMMMSRMGTTEDRSQRKRSDDAFKQLNKSAEEIYNVTEARDLIKDIREMKDIAKSRGSMSLTFGRAQGLAGIGGDPFGLKDVDIQRLGALQTGMVNKLAKDSGESGALSQADKAGFIENFPAVNSGNLVKYLEKMEKRILDRREEKVKIFNKRVSNVNSQYNTDFNANDFYSLDIPESTELEKAIEKPKFRGVGK